MSVYGGGGQSYERRGLINFDAIGEAWRLLTPQLGTWILAFLAMFGVNFAVMIVTFVMVFFTALVSKDLVWLTTIVCYLLSFVVSSFLTVGLYRMATKQTRGEAISAGDLIVPLDWNAAGTALLFVFIVILSMVTIIGPLIVAGLLMFAIPLAVEQRLKPTQAIRQSFDMLKSDWLMAAVFSLVIGIISMLGFLALGIGIIVTMPLFYLSVAVVYRRYVPAGVASPTWPGVYPGGMTPQYPPAAPLNAPIYPPASAPPLTQPIYPPASAPQPTSTPYGADAPPPQTLYGSGDAVTPPTPTLYGAGDATPPLAPSVLNASAPEPTAQFGAPLSASGPETSEVEATSPGAPGASHPGEEPAPAAVAPSEMERLASEMRNAAEPGAELASHDTAGHPEAKRYEPPQIP